MRGISMFLAASFLAGFVACGSEEGGGDGGPACGGGFAEETRDRYGVDPVGGCFLMGYFTGVVVILPELNWEEGWTLTGKVGDDPFTCTYVPGMVEGEPCSDNYQVEWSGQQVVLLHAHPCRVELELEQGGEVLASTRAEPEYEWSEPNGEGCGWKGVAPVYLDGAGE